MDSVEFERRRLRVYVAGPISKGDFSANVRRGIEWGKQMLRDGLAPYIPHLNATPAFVDGDGGGENWKGYLEWDLEWVAASEALFRIAGESAGADLEVEHAKSLGIPVFYNYPLLLEFAQGMHLTGKQKVVVP